MSDVAQCPAAAVSVDVHQEDVVVPGSNVDRYRSPVSFSYGQGRRVEVGLDIGRAQRENSEALSTRDTIRGHYDRGYRVPSERYWILNAC